MSGRPVGAADHLVLLVAAVGLVAAGIVGAAGAVGSGVRAVARSLPSDEAHQRIEDVEDLSQLALQSTSQPSTVFAADGSVLGRFRSDRLHSVLPADEIPATIKAAVVAAEDDRFWDHGGFDVGAIARAALVNGLTGEVAQGGSTITQQVAKLLVTGDDRTLARKVRELRAAVQLEKRFTKDEILAAYLNSIHFGSQAFGIEAASQTYLRKSARDLTLGEAALLVAVIPAPSYYNPRQAPDVAESRRQMILDRVEESGSYPPEVVASARREPPEIHPHLPAVERFPYYLDYVRIYLLEVVGIPPERLYGGGLEIHTSLDPTLQEAARQAVTSRLPGEGDPEAAVVVLAPDTGAVLALVGGRSWEDSQVNLALGRFGGGSGRQPGSSFKPFVLATAFEQGWSPRDVVDAPAEYLPSVPDAQPVKNYTRRGYGRVTVREATVRSINTAFMALTEEVGPGAVASLASRMGIGLPSPPDVGPSIGIGAYETSPLEMAGAYGAFARDGLQVHPSPVTRISVPEGTEPIEVEPIESGRAISSDTARLVTDSLSDVILRGTATAASFGRPAAAKTGTSDNHENAWLVGYTPQVVTAVWVGHPEGNVAMTDVAGFDRVTGGSVPAGIWRDVMAAAHQGLPVQGFPGPPDRPPRHGPGGGLPEEVPGDDGPGAGEPSPPQPDSSVSEADPASEGVPSAREGPLEQARLRICPVAPQASICQS